jgi:carbamoyltransferase
VLGISAFYHDSAAALVVNGDIVAAAQEERFSRKKHDPGFPALAARYCLEESTISETDLDYIAYYEKPLLKFDRLLETYLGFAPKGFRSFREALPVWLKEKLFLKRTIRSHLPAAPRAKLVFVEHHESHAASAFFPSPFEKAAILTVDGVGEWCSCTFGVGEGNRIRLDAQFEFPHSLGLLYSAFTYYCGFKVNSGEYKLMGLAPYGKPVYRDLILERLVDLKPDGSLWMNMEYFNYCQGLTMTNDRFDNLFDGPPRSPEATLEQRHMDLAASIQSVTEEAMLRMGEEVHRRTGQRNLVLAGGVALNCVANGRLSREGPFENIWIQPAAGDAGGALGAALFVWHQLLNKPRNFSGTDKQKGSLLGSRFSNDAIGDFLSKQKAPYVRYDRETELIDTIVSQLEQGKIVGWFQGRMEFGPRALGCRSIIGDARNAKMQADMNLKIKFRESFRPFAPVVLQERAHEYFCMRPGQESPYMLHVAPVLEPHRKRLDPQAALAMSNDPDLRKRVGIVRSTIPAVTHVDYSARVQTVDEARHGRFYRLLKAFEQKTGCPILVNTSYNVRGEPIVCTPEQAYRCFLATHIDVLVLENFVLQKSQISDALTTEERAKYMAQFELD